MNLLLLTACIDSIFISLAIVIISRRIFRSKKVTQDTIKGGICIYLLMGLLWAMLYCAAFILNPELFSNAALDSRQSFEQQFVRLFYFSFTTLTTLGYGDIVPQGKISMVLANLEAIVGQMYPAIYIARLVGLYSTEEIEKG
jgi:voltage-gated potassium channel Kch